MHITGWQTKKSSAGCSTCKRLSVRIRATTRSKNISGRRSRAVKSSLGELSPSIIISVYSLHAYSYGHGVLRKPDPRFIALQQFSSSRAELKDSPIIKLVNRTSEVAPGVLTEHGKVRTIPNSLDTHVVQ